MYAKLGDNSSIMAEVEKGLKEVQERHYSLLICILGFSCAQEEKH